MKACDRPEVTEVCVVGLTRCQGKANMRVWGSNTLNGELCESITELVMLDIHQKTEMVQEISADDGLLNICNDECPVKSASEA